MSEGTRDRIEGSVDEMGGRAKSAFGDATNDEQMRDEGDMDQLSGNAQQGVGNVKDAAGNIKDKLDSVMDKIKKD